MANTHLAQIESLLYREISLIIQKEFKDPQIGFVTVSRVILSPDLAHAKIYVSFLGKQERNVAGLKALNRAKGALRSACAKRMHIFKIPELTFIQDDSYQRGERIDNLLAKIKEEKDK